MSFAGGVAPEPNIHNTLDRLATSNELTGDRICIEFLKCCRDTDQIIPIEKAQAVLERPELNILHHRRISGTLFKVVARDVPLGEMPPSGTANYWKLAVALTASRLSEGPHRGDALSDAMNQAVAGSWRKPSGARRFRRPTTQSLRQPASNRCWPILPQPGRAQMST